MSRSARFSAVALSGAIGPYLLRDLGPDPDGPSARFAIGDLLGNGQRDLVVSGGLDEDDPSQGVRIFSRNGSGLSWIEQSTLEGLQDVRSIRIVDVDGDHDDDILIAADRSPHLSWIENLQSDDVGVNYCGPAATNSSGDSARISAVGSDFVTLNQLALRAGGLPANATGLFLVGQAQGFFPNAGGSSGTLCLGGAIGRYVGAGQVQTATSDGAMQLEVSLVAIPQPTGFDSAQAGTLWFFQAWYRDTVASQSTSNFTDGLAVVFR